MGPVVVKIDDALIINSYAGSLVLAAQAAGTPIRGSYEDVGYGVEIQQANFKGLDWRVTRADWPTRNDLRRSVVIAHPPCSAFSTMQHAAGTKGVDSEAFKCTVQVLEYAADHGAAAILVESVTGALKGAWHVHQRFAEPPYDYHLFRFVQDASQFGVPQARRRFWVAYLRRDVAGPRTWTMKLPESWDPCFSDVAERVPCEPFPEERSVFNWHLRKLEAAGLTRRQIDRLIVGDQTPGKILDRLRELFAPELRPDEVRDKFLPGCFVSKQLRRVDPDGLAPTVLGGTAWLYKDRLVSQVERKRVMGFPDGYRFPGRTLGHALYYLSKGIVPAVGAWLLEETVRRLERPRVVGDVTAVGGEVTDLREVGR